MKWLWSFIFLILFSPSYGQDWLKVAVPKDLNQTCLIVEKIDSVGPRCKDGKRNVYCNDLEKSIDKQLLSLQKLQENLFQKYKYEYIMVLPKAFPYQEFADLKDVNKFRYILKIHFFQSPEEKGSNPSWVYYFYDRKTQKAFPRIHQIQDVRFKNLKEFIEEVNSKFEPAEKK